MSRQPTPDILGDVLSSDPAPMANRLEVRRQLTWDYSQVPALHRKTVEDAAVDIAVSGRQMTASVMAIGDALLRAKGVLQHGQFEEWIRAEFNMSERTAQNMMNVARTFDGKSAKISLLSDSALYLLAAPSTPEPVREQVIAQAEAAGRSPSVAEVKAAIKGDKETRRQGEGETGSAGADAAARSQAAVVEYRQQVEQPSQAAPVVEVVEMDARPLLVDVVAAERARALEAWWVRIMGMLGDLGTWRELIGGGPCPEVADAGRALRKMLERTEAEQERMRGE